MAAMQDFTLAAGLNGFANMEAQMATVVISTIIIYTTVDIMSALVNIIINVPELGGEILNNAINNPHTYLTDYTKLLSMDGLIQNTIVLDNADNPEKCLTLTELKEKQEFKENLRMLHYIIIHGEVQKLLLAKLETNGTWTILLQAIIDKNTSLVDAGVIRQNFSIEMANLCSTCSRVLDIKCSIIINSIDDIMVMTDPFLPCLDVLSRYTWHLAGICYENPEIRTYIGDVTNNTELLSSFITHLMLKISEYDRLVLSPINENSAENLWIVMQQASQLLRYMVCIYTWYHPDYVTGFHLTPSEFVEFH